MISGINLSETKNYTSKYDSGEKKTVWKIGVLDSESMTVVMEEETKVLKTTAMAVRFGLRGFENFFDAQGNPVEFVTEQKALGGRAVHVVADKIMKIIPSPIVLELGTEILKMAQLSESEIKN